MGDDGARYLRLLRWDRRRLAGVGLGSVNEPQNYLTTCLIEGSIGEFE